MPTSAFAADGLRYIGYFPRELAEPLRMYPCQKVDLVRLFRAFPVKATWGQISIEHMDELGLRVKLPLVRNTSLSLDEALMPTDEAASVEDAAAVCAALRGLSIAEVHPTENRVEILVRGQRSGEGGESDGDDEKSESDGDHHREERFSTPVGRDDGEWLREAGRVARGLAFEERARGEWRLRRAPVSVVVAVGTEGYFWVEVHLGSERAARLFTQQLCSAHRGGSDDDGDDDGGGDTKGALQGVVPRPQSHTVRASFL